MRGRLSLLLWLRFRTVFRRRSVAATIGLVVGLVFLVPMALGGGVLSFVLTSWLAAEHPDLLPGWAHLVLLTAYFMIVVMPVIGFGASDFYDITKLFHLPVEHRTVFVAQAIGLLLGSTVLILLPGLLGLAVALPGPLGVRVLRVAVLLVFLFHAVAVGQFLQLAMLNVLRSRRFRDFAMVVGMLLWGGIFVGFRLLMESGTSRTDLVPLLSHFRDAWYLVPIPSYWVSSLLTPGSGLSWLLLFALGFVPLTVLIVLISAGLQERAFFGELPPARVRRRVRTGHRSRRVPFPLSRIPDDVRAIAGKELRLLRREPAVKTLLIHQFVFFLVPFGIAIWRTSGQSLDEMLRLALFLMLFVESNLVLNLFGLESPGIAHLLTTPVSRRRVLAGKILAYFCLWEALNLLLATAVCVALAAMGRPLPAMEVLDLFIGVTAALLLLLGLGSVISVLAPSRMTTRGRRALSQGQSNREGCVTALVRLGSFLVLAFLLIPVILLCYPWGLGPLSLLALPYAGGLLLAGLLLGARILRAQEETLVLRLGRSPD